jgi:transposase
MLHPVNDGYFVIGQKNINSIGKFEWSQAGWHIYDLEKALPSLKDMPDRYISQASFVTPRRIVSGTKAISCCFVDLDCYTLGITPDEHTIKTILSLADSYSIPRPSYIVKSGCGLYAKWILDRPLTDVHLQTWNQVQSVLISLYRALGADPKSRDSARVLRATSTVNSKNGSSVEVVHNENTRHNFAELAQRLSEVQVSTTLAVADKQSRRLAKIKPQNIALLEDPAAQDLSHLLTYSDSRHMSLTMDNNGLKGLNWRRFLDLRDLMIRRGGAKRGSRDLFIFSMTSSLALAGVVRPENFWGEVEQLLVSFPHSRDFSPLQDGSLNSLKSRIDAAARGEKSIYKGNACTPIYTPCNDTLINAFEITSDEEKLLRTIISSGEKRRRADLKVPGRAERRESRDTGRQAAVQLHSEGLNATQISEKLKVHRTTISRWIKAEADKPKDQSQIWDAQRIEQWRAKRQDLLQAQTHQREMLREKELHLNAAREAQGKLKMSIQVGRLMDKVIERSERVCKREEIGISSVRKIYSSQSSNSGEQKKVA